MDGRQITRRLIISATNGGPADQTKIFLKKLLQTTVIGVPVDCHFSKRCCHGKDVEAILVEILLEMSKVSI